MARVIKIGRHTVEVKNGDYVLFNGAVHMFCSGDKRIIRRDGFTTYSHIPVSIRFITQHKVKSFRKEDYTEGGVKFTKYYF